MQRASYRDAAQTRRLLEPGQIVELRITGPATSNLFSKGHRIRVQVSGSFAPVFSRNLQSGELENVSAKVRAATIRLHQDEGHRSRVILPVVRP